ncbi:MAG: DNA/RNA non-specific endonuclease [Prevotellaceae bacterium]|nr:DNA/RNA non-specific endonuclease [Prevotellaceae bacterium]
MLFFAACRPEETALELTLDNAVVSSEENDQFLRIATGADVAWTLNVLQGSEWCTVTPSTGIGTKNSVRVLVSENNATEQRTAIISVTAGNTTQSVQLTQEKMTLLSVTVGHTEIISAAASLPIQIKTKETWTISVTQEENFCSVTPATGTGNATVTAAFTQNTGTQQRVATINISIATDDVSVAIRQLAPGEVLGGTRIEQTIPNRMELPVVDNKRWYIEHLYYAMEYDTAQRHSVWVAYVLNAAYLQKRVSRSDAWAQDPQIPYEFSSTRADFSGYDRGHLLPSADRVFSYEANAETFYYSNMSPQLGAFNQRIWANLEIKVREWAGASDCDTLYIVTGGAIKAGIATIQKGNGMVTIPRYYFKALLKRKGNAFDAIAFWMENTSHSNNTVTHDYSITIRELEQKTGINFFPNLPNADVIESIRTTTKWPL